jgi:hypothetical protein
MFSPKRIDQVFFGIQFQEKTGNKMYFDPDYQNDNL